MSKRSIPGHTKWSMYAGGTSVPSDKHGYSITTPKGRYNIVPYSSSHGRFRGYMLYFENSKGALPGGLHQQLNASGEAAYGHTFRSPATAATAANAHWEKNFPGESALSGLGIIPGIGIGTIAAGLIGYMIGKKVY